MAYTTIDDPSAYFQTTLYNGTGSSQAVTNTGNSDLQPDWVWLKVRSNGTYGHAIFDSVRGVNKVIGSNTTNAEEDQSSDVSLSSFNSDGFTVGGYFNNVNQSGQTFVSWQWKAGTGFTNDASGTSIGSIDSAGSVNTDAGFSIIKWTGNDANATVAHGLGAVPGMFIVKNLSNATTGWYVYHQSLGNTKHILLDTAAALVDDINWNDTSPTSTVINLGGQTGSNGPSNSMLVYCFAEKKGYSKFSSYTGNANADGTFVYTGFKPAMVICKKSSASGTNWGIIDNKRANPFNEISAMLNPNSSGTEGANNDCDFLSNGFKWRTNDGNSNASATYIYMAFAENPFVTSTGVPATAR